MVSDNGRPPPPRPGCHVLNCRNKAANNGYYCDKHTLPAQLRYRQVENHYITELEEEIANRLGEVWNLYIKLPVQGPNHQAEFCALIHRCQDHILARVGKRQLTPGL